MQLRIDEIRVRNFRSIHEIDVKLENINILIGQNNSGKTNFLSAINIGLLPYKELEVNDIYWSSDEEIDKSKKAIIDIKIIPDDNSNEFDDFWSGVFTENWITIEGDYQYVGIRTIIQYDVLKDSYETNKFPIKTWGKTVDECSINKSQRYTSDMSKYLNVFFMDALRDFAQDIKDKKSYFGKMTTTIKLDKDVEKSLEEDLTKINDTMINSIDIIESTNESMSDISPLFGNDDSYVSIEPLARTLNDLHRGMDVVIKDKNARSFSISEYGMGTKSWMSFLVLRTYVKYFIKKLKENNDDDFTIYDMLLLEEPEAHLHPQAQRQLLLQLSNFEGQKLISTHSAHIVSQCEPKSILFFKKQNGVTNIIKYDSSKFDKNEENKIKREIIKSKGELLFANCIILCEGMTEEIQLPIYFKKYFGYDPSFKGITFISVGGKNYPSFIKLMDMFSINWFIFSDGEPDALKTLRSIFKSRYANLEEVPNLVYFNNSDCIERYLIRENYSEEILKAIEQIDGADYYNSMIAKSPVPFTVDKKLGKKCEYCGNDIKETVSVDMENLNREQYELYRFICRGNGKTKYCEQIAIEICESEKSIPNKMKELFDKIDNLLKLNKNEGEK